MTGDSVHRRVVERGSARIAAAWQTPTLVSGYTPHGGGWRAPRFTKLVGGFVVVEGRVITTAAKAAFDPIFYFPAGFIPDEACGPFAAGATTGSGLVRLDVVPPSGAVRCWSALASGIAVSLDSIRYSLT